MKRAAVRDWAAQRAMVVLGALLKMASAAAEYVNGAMEVPKPPSVRPGPDQR